MPVTDGQIDKEYTHTSVDNTAIYQEHLQSNDYNHQMNKSLDEHKLMHPL